MDREKYARIFLRTGNEFRGVFGGAGQAPPFAPDGLRTVRSIGGEGDTARWVGGGMDDGRAFALDSAATRSPEFRVSAAALDMKRPLHIEASLRAMAIDRGTTAHAVLICTFLRDGREVEATVWPVNDLPLEDDRNWRPWRYAITMPAPGADDELSCYVKLDGPGRMAVRDLRFRLLLPAAAPERRGQ
jgi:hypothetical protein